MVRWVVCSTEGCPHLCSYRQHWLSGGWVRYEEKEEEEEEKEQEEEKEEKEQEEEANERRQSQEAMRWCGGAEKKQQVLV